MPGSITGPSNLSLWEIVDRPPVNGDNATVADTAQRFSDALARALQGVNNAQREADSAAEAFAVGDLDDVGALMMAVERANLSLQLTIQVRNKVLEAYQEIIRMPV